MATNTQVLKTFRSYLGEGGSRAWKYCGMSGGAWCDAEVSTVFYNAGAKSLWFGKQTYCPTTIKLCEANMALIPPYIAMGGDVIFFDWEHNGVPNHIGMVDHKISTSSIGTIEGNTGSPARVRQKTRPVSYVQGIFRPHYKPENLPVEDKITVDGNFGYVSIYFLQKALGITADCVLGKDTVKALQKKAGASADGAWGKSTSKKVQKMIGATADGEFGEKSVKALQKWINKQNSPSEAVTTEGVVGNYTGKYPELPPKTAKIAVQCAYAYGTSKSVYKYKGGKPKKAYKEALNKAYPNRKGWKYAKSRAGASCDVFAGTVLKNAGYKTAPHAMSKMVSWCKKHLKKVSSAKNGDILTRTNHVMVFLELKGKKYVANAHYQNLGGTYGIIEKVGKHTKIWRPAGLSYLSKGDTFTSVIYLKKYLNWYGFKLEENYSFDDATESAVKEFQTANGLTADGTVGEVTLAKMKEVSR